MAGKDAGTSWKSISEPQIRVPVVVASAGNPLLGDDGVGHVVLERLRARSVWGGRVAFHPLEGDLLELADWAGRADYLIVLDAIAGDTAGRIERIAGVSWRHAPSFHQADVATTLGHLEAVYGAKAFPRWEVWGIHIAMPPRFNDHLSAPVEAAAVHLERLVAARITDLLAQAP